MADPMTPERLAEIREREQAATPGPWEPGACWLTAGLIWDDDGKRVPPDEGTRCGFCHVGDPVWSGQTHINGTLMNAHRHRNPEPWDVENLISAANGDLVAGNFDYGQGGIIAPADTVFVAAAREDVPALLAEVERLRAELAKRPKSRLGEQVNRLSNAVGDLERERDDALAEVERLRAELAETTHALEVTGEKVTALRKQRDQAETERDRIRLAWDSARRGRRSARLLNRELIASMDMLHRRLQRHMDDKNTAAAHFTNQYSRMHLERDQMRTERDAAREQVKDTERAVHAYFADADQRGVHLDGMTVDELCDAVMAEIRKEPGQ